MTKELKIFLASPRGFCAGVDRAIEIVKKIRSHITSNDLYKGLKTVQELIEHETRVLDLFNKDLEELDDKPHE